MRPAVTTPDAEALAIEAIEVLLGDRDENVTVGISLPDDAEDPAVAQGWPESHPPHVMVADDGTTSLANLANVTLLRVTVWAASTSEAKRLADLVEALMCSSASAPWFQLVRRAGRQAPTMDPETRAQLASVLLRCTVRSSLLAP